MEAGPFAHFFEVVLARGAVRTELDGFGGPKNAACGSEHAPKRVNPSSTPRVVGRFVWRRQSGARRVVVVDVGPNRSREPMTFSQGRAWGPFRKACVFWWMWCSVHALGQEEITTLSEWEVWRFLSHSIEEGRLTQTGAEAVLRHLQDRGWPVSSEVAWRIEGLSMQESTWLAGTEAWRGWVLRHEAWTPSKRASMAVSWTSAWKLGEEANALSHDMRLRLGGWRGRMLVADSLRLSGSWAGIAGGWSWALGSHQVGWGQGLTIPRTDAFGLALFLGGSEVKLPLSPRGLNHAEFAGGLKGVAVEHRGTHWTHGVTAGRHHLGLSSRCGRTQTWGLSCFAEEDDLRAGLDGSGKRRNVDWQLAGAWSSNEGLLVRVNSRWAQSKSWVVQCAYEAVGTPWQSDSWQSQWRLFSTWQNLESGGLVQARIRFRGEREWDCRFQGHPSKRHPWRWSIRGSPEEWMGGLHVRHQALKASWWVGRDRSGKHAFARHVEGAWGESQGRQWGLFALDGTGSWEGAYVMVRALDGRVWSRTPNEGWRLGLWVTSHVPKKGSWTAQCTWSRSQQETFRCAVRWRWEP